MKCQIQKMVSIRLCRVLQSILRRSRVGAYSSTSTSGPGSVEVTSKEPQGKEINVAVSSLRVDTVAAAGLDISRKCIWEAVMDEMVLLNGKTLKKKSTSVKQGDIVEVDSILDKRKSVTQDSIEGSKQEQGSEGDHVTVRRGRVVVKEIGEQTRKGGYHLTLIREKYDDQTGQDSPSKPSIANFVPNEDIQFGYHSASGRQIRITNDGLRAERKGPHTVADDGVAYGARPLKGLAEFEVKIVSYWAKCASSIQLGVMRCKKGALIEPGTSIYQHAVNHCVWGGQQLFNNLVTPSKTSDYGYVELGDVHVGDCVGLRVSEDGSLEFFVNGKSQGIAIRNIYTRKSDIYPVVDHRCDSAATVITKAVTQCDDIDLQEICLEKLSGWFTSGDEVDRLPLPTRLKDKLKSYIHE